MNRLKSGKNRGSQWYAQSETSSTQITKTENVGSVEFLGRPIYSHLAKGNGGIVLRGS